MNKALLSATSIINASSFLFHFLPLDFEEVENTLLHNLPSLCCHLSDWSSLLCVTPGLQLSEYKGPRSTQYCMVILLHLALQQGDRLLPDQTVFSSVVVLLQSAQGGCAPPRFVLRSALYLLAATQDKIPDLDRAPLSCISKVLSSQSFSSLYIHHPALLHFIYRYPDLVEKFGSLVLELWLTKQTQHTDAEQSTEKGEERESSAKEDKEPDTETLELLTLIEKHPAVLLTLLDMVCTREPPWQAELWECWKSFCEFRETLMNSLPLLLKLLCVMEASDPPSSSSDSSKMDGVHFKLLYHAVSVLLSNSGLMTSCRQSSLPPPLLLFLLFLLLLLLLFLTCSISLSSLSPAVLQPPPPVLPCYLAARSLVSGPKEHQLESGRSCAATPPVVSLTSGPGLVGPRPLGVEDGSLYPLGTRGAQCLSTALSGLLLQKHELLLRASVNCLGSLLGFLQRRSPSTGTERELSEVRGVSAVESLLQHGSSKAVYWEPDLLQVMEAVEGRGVKELSEEAAQSLRLLLTQIQRSVMQPPLTEEQKQRVRSVIMSLALHTPPNLPGNVLYPSSVK
ncbi:hypothetical protein F7725_003850, partial [Dissostichus mawsoni]